MDRVPAPSSLGEPKSLRVRRDKPPVEQRERDIRLRVGVEADVPVDALRGHLDLERERAVWHFELRVARVADLGASRRPAQRGRPPSHPGGS